MSAERRRRCNMSKYRKQTLAVGAAVLIMAGLGLPEKTSGNQGGHDDIGSVR